MPLILPTKSRKMHLQEYVFSKFPRGGACPKTPLGVAFQRHARVGLSPKYSRIIAIFPPVKNFSYIPICSYKIWKLECGILSVKTKRMSIPEAMKVLLLNREKNEIYGVENSLNQKLTSSTA